MSNEGGMAFNLPNTIESYNYIQYSFHIWRGFCWKTLERFSITPQQRRYTNKKILNVGGNAKQIVQIISIFWVLPCSSEVMEEGSLNSREEI